MAATVCINGNTFDFNKVASIYARGGRIVVAERGGTLHMGDRAEVSSLEPNNHDEYAELIVTKTGVTERPFKHWSNTTHYFVERGRMTTYEERRPLLSAPRVGAVTALLLRESEEVLDIESDDTVSCPLNEWIELARDDLSREEDWCAG